MFLQWCWYSITCNTLNQMIHIATFLKKKLLKIYLIYHPDISRQANGHTNGLTDEQGKSNILHLTHWGRVTHIYVSKLTIIGSDNGLSPDRRQAIIWINAGILLIRALGTNFSEILGEIHLFSFSKMHLKMSSAKWLLFGLGINELTSQEGVQ